jgi:aspartyl-tRNA(Asn)/glutamyl-tRNA(Gln) amidotransferase subunit A
MRERIKKEFKDIFEQVDVIATPTSPFPPFKFGEKMKDPLSMYLSDLFVSPANIAGIPAMSVPSGKNANGLPLGFHIMGSMFSEEKLFEIGKDIEKLV